MGPGVRGGLRGLGVRVYGLCAFRVWGSGVRVKGFGFEV